MPIGSIQQNDKMAALNIQKIEASDEISAQKKYKLELQAEINKLRTKYQDYGGQKENLSIDK